MFYTKEELQSLNRKELQKLCKQFAIKANKKNCELVSDLVEYFSRLQEEAKTLTEDLELKQWMSEDEETSATEKAESNKQMKDNLMKEVEKRANEKLSKIPRFQAEGTIASTASPSSRKLQISQQKQFKKMDSIDVYLEKKKNRMKYQMNYHTKLKKQAEYNLKRMKLSHNTPKADTANITARKSKGSTPVATKTTKRASTASFKVDKEVTFNFTSKLKSPKPVLKESNLNKSAISSSYIKPTRKSFKNVSILDTKSPGVKTTSSSSATKKTPAKFDLQASLKKRLSYKPHSGKLKGSYIADKSSGANTTFNANSTFTLSPRKDAKQLSKPKAKAKRENRRNEATKRRDNKRADALSKRRGIQT